MNEKHTMIEIDDARLEKYAENQARELKISGNVNAKHISNLINRQLKQLNRVHSVAVTFASKERTQPKELEWLLDNWYLAEREGREAAHELKKTGRLPGSKGHGGLPAVYVLAKSLVFASGQSITLERIRTYFSAAQRIRPLEERELWLIKNMLKAAIVDSITDLCQSIPEILEGYSKNPLDNPFAAEKSLKSALENGLEISEECARLAGVANETHERIGNMLGRAFTSLRMLSNVDIADLLSEMSVLESILSRDPSGIYEKLDERTKAYYRRQLSAIARRKRVPENVAAQEVLSKAELGIETVDRHVGRYILDTDFVKNRKRLAGKAYFCAMFAGTAAIVAAAGYVTGSWVACALLVLPVSDLVKNFLDFITVRVSRPRFVPRLELEEGIPDEGKTLGIICALVTSAGKAVEHVKQLERYKTANKDAGANLVFGLLLDLKDAKTPTLQSDKMIIEAAASEIEALNKRHGGGFFLFTRERVKRTPKSKYMAWERKRGAINELMMLLRSDDCDLHTATGDREDLRGINYVISLDADTILCAGCAREMVGAMLHPLNRPVIDPEKRVVVHGYGLLQPRISVDLESAGKSVFSRVFAGQGGIDPYSSTTSDVYYDLFDKAIFTGKGIIDVEAYLTCLDGRFPENRILSHDLLEGTYLRTGLIGDVELTDSYPHKAITWFDRLHRWVRGDWQIISWLGGRVKTETSSEKNPISALSKWKILDNLRRSAVPIFTLLSFASGLIIGGWTLFVTAAIALLCAMSNFLLCAADLALRSRIGRSVRYHSTVVAGVHGAFLQTALLLVFLPYHASVCAHAIVTSLYRMIVSKRNLLEWVTADEAENVARNTVAYYYRRMFISCLWGTAALVTPAIPVGIAVGILWIISPELARLCSKVDKQTKKLSDRDKIFLKREAALMWRYFEDFLTKEDNYLPPDNWQEQPAVGIAHRTSPTNIGLSLLCTLGALDLELTNADHALDLIDKTLSTVERMQKWNGHLLNWYDTRNLNPLFPRSVSSVDSGNFVGCLIALREGLLEISNDKSKGLACRCNNLIEEMSFIQLFDKKRKLFYIGYDIESGKYSESYYDLMASEARQTSYIAIARGEVERKHWSRLGRSLTACDGFRGMVSWTGTMFEYFMPGLLMPTYPNSLLYESARFALYCQKRHGAQKKVPWGISESAFYAFDGALNYQYKAHGVQKLGLKRGLDRELVVSPYSTFLALSLEPQAAIANLRKLRTFGMEGRYGFFESADFTPTRMLSESEDYEIVRCFMVHHVGMSLISVANALRENIMQNRFMRDIEMASFSELLQEKVPVGVATLRSPAREVPEKPSRTGISGYSLDSIGYDAFLPRCHLLNNGSYTLFVTDTGLSKSSLADVSLTRFEARQTGGACGMSFFAKTGEKLISLTPAPFFDPEMKYYSVFKGDIAKLISEGYGLKSVLECRVPHDENSEIREVVLTNNNNMEVEIELACYFEPILANQGDYEAHPAYSKLFLEIEKENSSLIMYRRSRGDRKGLYAVFTSDASDISFDASREIAMGRGGFDSIESALFKPPSGTTGAVLDPCVLARVKCKLGAGESKRVKFALAVASEKLSAVESAMRTLHYTPDASELGRLDSTAALLGLTHNEMQNAMDMLCALVFTVEQRRQQIKTVGVSMAKKELWAFGISGDLPILGVLANGDKPAEKVARIVRQHKYLQQNGAKCDLVFLTQEGAEYRQPTRSAIIEALKSVSSETGLGILGGVHIINSVQSDDFRETLLRYHASIFIELEQGMPAFNRTQRRPKSWTTEDANFRLKAAGAEASVALMPEMDALRYNKESEFDEPKNSVEYLSDGAVRFRNTDYLQKNSWSHIITNGAFGYLATDCGSGHMWRYNSRENKMIPWMNDPLAIKGAEQICVIIDGKSYSVFCSDDGCEMSVTYGFGYAIWHKKIGAAKITTTAMVPPKSMARVLRIEVSGVAEAEILYYSEVIMGVSSSSRAGVVTHFDEHSHVLTAENPANPDFNPQRYHLISKTGVSEFTCDAISWMLGEFDGKNGAGLMPCFGTRMKMEREGNLLSNVIVTGCSANNSGLELIKSLLNQNFTSAIADQKEKLNSSHILEVSTPDLSLNHYINGWAVYQTKECRCFARTSLYQCGGAYGFRDQLQDSCALVLTNPEILRLQLIRAAAHQYREGDVQHWWHPQSKNGHEGHKGVRTKCSDDLLWLPYSLCEYLEKTGDDCILGIKIPFIVSVPLGEREHERYEIPETSSEREGILEHCVRAIELALARGTGEHGLAKIGTGDWNDGFNLVGAEGRGESVWLTWFLSFVLERFAGLCEKLGRSELAKKYRRHSSELGESANKAWDGEWYLRGYFDNGELLGSNSSEECKIDSIAQSFSVFSPLADPDRRTRAIQSAIKHLVDRDNKVVKLFAPPFKDSHQNPGYIKGYVAGVRENGGQYTHAAAWLAMACLMNGMNDDGYEILSMLLPATHDIETYKAEPYVLAADVYSNPAHVGRGGWSWYTGAAGWYFRVVVENLLGILVLAETIIIKPNMPSHWKGFSVKLRRGASVYTIDVTNCDRDECKLDGQVHSGDIPIAKDGKNHHIEVCCKSRV